MASPKGIILMADYGHDPTETAIPWTVFTAAGFTVSFATENGTPPQCDSKMLSGITGALLGANKSSKQKYLALESTSASFQHPLAWTDPNFTLDEFDLVFLPGGHDKGMRQIIDSERVHELLGRYFPQTRRPQGKKVVAAICHGVQVLANTKIVETGQEGVEGVTVPAAPAAAEGEATAPSANDGQPSQSQTTPQKSVLSTVKTTALPHLMEQGIFQATRLFLGDYYKTYGAGTQSVQKAVTDSLEDASQFVSSIAPGPFVVEDDTYNYLSARFPPDAELLATRAVERVRKVVG